jgi:hypothetical protein
MLPVLMVLGAISLVGTGISLYCDAQAADQRRLQAKLRADAERRHQAHQQALRDAQAKAQKLERRRRLVKLGAAKAKLAQATALVVSLTGELGLPGLQPARRAVLLAQLEKALAAQARWLAAAEAGWREAAG